MVRFALLIAALLLTGCAGWEFHLDHTFGDFPVGGNKPREDRFDATRVGLTIPLGVKEIAIVEKKQNVWDTLTDSNPTVDWAGIGRQHQDEVALEREKALAELRALMQGHVDDLKGQNEKLRTAIKEARSELKADQEKDLALIWKILIGAGVVGVPAAGAYAAGRKKR